MAAGTYKPTTTTGPDSRTVSFALKEGVAIYGGFAGAETALGQRPAVNPNTSQPSSTTLSGDIGTVGDASDNSYHVVRNPAGLTDLAVLDGFVIAKGNADGQNSNGQGGGMNNAPVDYGPMTTCSPTIRNCFFAQNKAVTGGGIAIIKQAGSSVITSPSIQDCLFIGNTASSGGAIFNGNFWFYSSNPVVTNCTFQNNSASSGGVVTCVSSGSFSTGITFVSSSFRRNSATNGGVASTGGDKSSASASFINSTFEENTATRGGVFFGVSGDFATSYAFFTNCSFRSNSATNKGGIAYVDWNRLSTEISFAEFINCIIWDNGGTNTFSTNRGARVSSTNSLLEPSVTNYVSSPSNLTATVSPFASTTSLQLSPCSPAVNAGSNTAIASYSLTTDLAGNPRFYNNGVVDMGAYEYQGDAATPVVITSQPGALTVCQGSPAQALVAASGSVSSYQWFQNGTALTGQTSATLTVANATTAQAGTYSVAVVGQCSSVTSTNVNLVVNPAPTLLSVNSGTLTCAQTSVTLIASANGDSTFTLSDGQRNTTGQFVINQPSTYTLTATHASGCSSATTTTVSSDTVAPTAPQLTDASRQIYTSSVPLALNVYVVPPAGGSLSFSATNGPLLTPVVSVSTAGEQVYAVQQRGSNGCLSAPVAFTLIVVPLLATEPTGAPFAVSLAPNPVINQWLRATVQGVKGQTLFLQLLTTGGAVLQTQQYPVVTAEHHVEWVVSHYPAGVYLLRAQAGEQSQTVRVLIQ